MGNALRSYEDLVHVRGWTREQISAVFETLRRKRAVYSMTKDEFTRYFGGRNREVTTVFSDLDTDYDGKVDIFEVLVVLTLWSGTSWEEKQSALFEIFDMMGKGFLLVDEVMMMGTVLVQTLKKFVKVDADVYDAAAITDFAHKALPPNQTQVTSKHFRLWAKNYEPLEKLRGFLEDHAARSQPKSHQGRMRTQLSATERHARTLFERIERLQDRLPGFTDACIDYVSAWGRRKRWDFMMQNMRHLVLKLQQLSESLHSTLADLEMSLNEDERTGNLSSVVDPKKRFKQEHMLLDLARLRDESLTDFREATMLLKRLIALTEPNEIAAALGSDQMGGEALNVITEEEGEGMIDMSPPRVVESRAMMKMVHSEMLADTEEGGLFAWPSVTQALESTALPAPSGGAGGDPGRRSADGAEGQDAASRVDTAAHSGSARGLDSRAAGQLGGEALSSQDPTLIAIAEFEPPPSHQTHMLKLHIGDAVTIIGQDGRGWWYGRNQTGREGWFPPSYVQTKAAHFTSGGDS